MDADAKATISRRTRPVFIGLQGRIDMSPAVSVFITTATRESCLRGSSLRHAPTQVDTAHAANRRK